MYLLLYFVIINFDYCIWYLLFSTNSMTLCKMPENNTCEDKYFKGGGACCLFIKDSFSHRIIHFMSITGGIMSSLLFVVMIILHTIRIIDKRFGTTNIIYERPVIVNSSVEEIDTECRNDDTMIDNQNITIAEIDKMDSDINNCINSLNFAS